ncbi:MAG: alpha/beta fold hydrolase [Promethearchaeota archaeon]
MERESDLIHPNASEYEDFSENYAVVNGIQIYYEYKNVSIDIKENKGKTAILLIHGWTANRLRLHPLYLHFIEKKTPVFRLDLRGHGWSQKEQTNDFSIATMANDVDEFVNLIICEKLGFSSVILVGHSMGGSVCMSVAIKKPNYLKKLILLSTSAHWSETILDRLKIKIYAQVYRFNYWDRYNKKKPGHEIHGLEHFPMWSKKYNTGGRTLFTAREATIQGLLELVKFDVREDIKSLKIPTLIVVGADDIDAHPSLSKKIHELIPNSKMIIIPGVNHDVAIGKPITLANHIDQFLENS